MNSIGDALTLRTGKLIVDGALMVAEHGDYPFNDKQQQLYPRFEFFEQVVRVFRRSGRAVPVYSDKHLSFDWAKARQMYDWSRELNFSLMAGSSLPVTFRRPEFSKNYTFPTAINAMCVCLRFRATALSGMDEFSAK